MFLTFTTQSYHIPETSLYSTHGLSVVHDTVVVIRDAERIGVVSVILVEIILEFVVDVFIVDLHVAVSIGSRLFVVETDRVAQLVNNNAFLEELKRLGEK